MSDDSLYQTARKKVKLWKTVLWISVLGIIVPPLVGMAGTVIAMVKTIDQIGMTGSSDPEVLAGDISQSIMTTAGGLLMTTAGGLLISILALPVLVLSLVMLSRIRKTSQERPLPNA